MWGRDKSRDKTREKEPIQESIKEKAMKFTSDSSQQQPTTRISRETEVAGDLRFSGVLEVEGRVCGNINAAAGQSACVRILEHGVIEGDIHAPVVVVNGTVKGSIHSDQQVELASQARVEGDIHYALVEMVKGARINGGLVYTGNKPGLKVASSNTAIGNT